MELIAMSDLESISFEFEMNNDEKIPHMGESHAAQTRHRIPSAAI